MSVRQPTINRLIVQLARFIWVLDDLKSLAYRIVWGNVYAPTPGGRTPGGGARPPKVIPEDREAKKTLYFFIRNFLSPGSGAFPDAPRGPPAW